MHLQEFYHRQLDSAKSDIPRIFGMTASPIKSKSMQPLKKNLILLLLIFSGF